jgi:hypothetical protein
MENDKKVPAQKLDEFFSPYAEEVFTGAMKLRDVLFANLPGIIEQIDTSAKMVAYSYGQKYIELVCVIIPSKKGLKLGFNRGVDLPDPDGILEGTGKISRYVEIKSENQIKSLPIKRLLESALNACKKRMASAKK